MKHPTLAAVAIVTGGLLATAGMATVISTAEQMNREQRQHDMSVELTIETFYDSFDPVEQEQVCDSWKRDPEPFWIAFDKASNGATTIDVLDEAMTVVCDASA